MKTSLYENIPWVSQSLYKAFSQSRDEAIKKLYDTNALRITLPWVVAEVEEEANFLGDDIWPFGVEANRKTGDIYRVSRSAGALGASFHDGRSFAPPNTFDMYKT